MLSVSRKANQRVIVIYAGKQIGSIRVKKGTRGGQVRLEIDLPIEFVLMREELLEETAA